MFRFANNRYNQTEDNNNNYNTNQRYYQQRRPQLQINTSNDGNNFNFLNYKSNNNLHPVTVPNKGNNVELQISYQNYFGDEQGYNTKKSYADELRAQIEENRRKRELERQRQKEEDLKEELRLKREQEILRKKAELEEMKRQSELAERKKENERIISSYSVMSHPRSSRPKKKVKFTADMKKERELSEYEKYLLKRKEEINNFNQEILDMLNNIRNKHAKSVDLVEKEIDNVKKENFYSNLYKVDLKKGMKELKDELKLKHLQEDFKKDYIYNLYVKTRRNRDEMDKYYQINKFRLPTINLSHHIHCPGLLIDNGWYFDNSTMQMIDDEEYRRDQRNLHNLLVCNSVKLNRLKKLETSEF